MKLPAYTLTLAQRAALLGAITPIGALLLAIKYLRLQLYAPDGLSLIRTLNLLAADLFFVAALACLGLAIAGRELRWTRALLISLICQILLFFEALSFVFYTLTGSTLSWDLIALYLRYPGELGGFVSLSTDTVQAIVSLSVSLILGLLYLGAAWVTRRAHPPAEPVYPPPPRALLWAGVVLGLALTALFPIGSAGKSVGRQSVIQIAATWMTHRDASAQHTSGAALREPWRARTISAVSAEAPQRSIVLIMLESTRHQSTSLDASGPPTTPHMLEAARRGLSFSRGAHAIIPYTTKALFAIHCSASPFPTPHIREAASHGVPVACLPELLRQHDYQTAFFHSGSLVWEHNYTLLSNIGYEHLVGSHDLQIDSPPINYLGHGERELIGPSRAWLKARDRSRPFLLTYLTLAAHHTYHTPATWPQRDLHPTPLYNSYLNAIAYSDAFFKDVMDLLEEEGLGEEVIVAVVGDHGEAFGEHRQSFHTNVIYEEALRVPLFFVGPGVPLARVEGPPMNQLDVMPTLLGLAGFSSTGGFEGVDLADAEARARPRQTFSLCLRAETCGAVVQWPYKYFHYFGERSDELFHLEQDPGELHNLLDAPDATLPTGALQPAAAREALLSWIAQSAALHASPVQE